jgi:hypothetical protein
MSTIEEIQHRLHESRRHIALHYIALSEEIDITLRLRNAVRRRPWSWIGAAFATGIITTFFKKSRSSNSLNSRQETAASKKPSSLIERAGTIPLLLLGETTVALAAGKLLRFLFPLLRPIVTEYLKRRFDSSEKQHPTAPSSSISR